MFELCLTSLRFLISYSTDLSRKGALLGDSDNQDALYKGPVEYFTQWILNISEFQKWPHRIAANSESSSTEDSICILPTVELIAVLHVCLDKLSIRILHNKPPDITSKKKRQSYSRASDIADSSPSKAHLLLFQSLSLLWFITIKVGYDYLSKYRPDLPTSLNRNCSLDQLSWFPLSISSIIPCAVPGSGKPLNSEYHPLLHLSELWRLRKFTNVGRCYSFCIDSVDMLNKKVCPSLSSFETECKETCLEQLIHFDLFLSDMGMRTASELNWGLAVLKNTESDKDGDDITGLLQLDNVYSRDEVIFLKWLGSIMVANRSADEIGKESLRKRYIEFIDQFPTLLVPNNSNQTSRAVQITSDCWILPFTRSNIDYIGVKAITWWLYRQTMLDFDRQPSSSMLDIMCLVCVLSQIDSTAEHFLTDYPSFDSSASENLISVIQKHWNIVRSRFLDWLQSPVKFIEDVGLLNRLAQIELEFQGNTFLNLEPSDLLLACIACLQTPAVEPITLRLRKFIETESESIKSHLNSSDQS